jgi:hypothetical protein
MSNAAGKEKSCRRQFVLLNIRWPLSASLLKVWRSHMRTMTLICGSHMRTVQRLSGLSRPVLGLGSRNVENFRR